MYKASLGLVGLAAVALIFGWVQQSNPATWFSIVAAIVAGLLLIASWLMERTRGGQGDLSPSGAADASGAGTWTAPPPSSSAWSPAGSSSFGRSSVGSIDPDYDTDDALRSAPMASSSTGATERYDPDRFGSDADSRMAADSAMAAADSTMAMPAEDAKRRFGRKSTAPVPASAVDERVAELRALSESTSADLYSLTEEEGDAGASEPDSRESQLARAQREVEDLLAQPVESFRPPEPERPAPRPEVARTETSRSEATRAPEPMRGAPSHEQDEWLQAAMRRREARKASGTAAPGAKAPAASSAETSGSIAPSSGGSAVWTPPAGAPPPGRSAPPAEVAAREAAEPSAPSGVAASTPASAAPSAGRTAPAAAQDASEVLTWSQRRRRTRLGADPGPDYELNEIPSASPSPRRRPRAEPEEEADFELIPVPGEELPEELPEELAAVEEEEFEEPEEVAVPTPRRTRRTAGSFAEPAQAAELAPAKPATRRRTAAAAEPAAAAPAPVRRAAAKAAAPAPAKAAPGRPAAPARPAAKGAAKAAAVKAAPAKAAATRSAAKAAPVAAAPATSPAPAKAAPAKGRAAAKAAPTAPARVKRSAAKAAAPAKAAAKPRAAAPAAEPKPAATRRGAAAPPIDTEEPPEAPRRKWPSVLN